MTDVISATKNDSHDERVENLIKYHTIKFRLFNTYGEELVTSIMKSVPIIGESAEALKILEEQMKKYA